MEELELNDENDGTSPTEVESETLENNVEETTSPTADLEMSNNDSTLDESQDNNIDSEQNESTHPTE